MSLFKVIKRAWYKIWIDSCCLQFTYPGRQKMRESHLDAPLQLCKLSSVSHLQVDRGYQDVWWLAGPASFVAESISLLT